MPLLEHELARRENGSLVLRPTPVRLRWDLNDLVTTDGHRLRAMFSCSVRMLDEASERAMLAETFLAGGPSLTAKQLTDHFTPSLRTAALKLTKTDDAEHWLGDESRPALIDALCAAAKPVAFSSGVELLGPFQIDLESPTLAQDKLEAMQRKLAERRTEGQVEHFNRAATFLKQFQSLRESSPGLSPGAILQNVSDADRGGMLQTLLLASAQETKQATLWVVAGATLVSVDLRAQPVATRIIEIPTDLGPLRSVHPATWQGQRRLLVGARSGVIVFDPAGESPPILLSDASIVSPRGFSQAVVWNDQIWACHSDAGLVAWSPDAPAAPIVSHRPGAFDGIVKEPRFLNVLDGDRLLFASGNRLITLTKDNVPLASPVPGSPSEIVGIVLTPEQIIAVHEDGQVAQHHRSTLAIVSRQRCCGRVTSASTLPWLGSQRLLLASDAGPIYCIGLDDTLSTQYLSHHHGLRNLAAAADLVVAVSNDRQRLVAWKSWDGKQPAAEVHIAGLTRHRIADADFG